MLSVSDGLKYIAEKHCVRFPIINGAMDFYRTINTSIVHQFCNEPDLFCNPEKIVICNPENLLPFYDYKNFDLSCYTRSLEITQECGDLIGSIVKRYGDIVLDNTSGIFSVYANTSFIDCNDIVTDFRSTKDVSPGIPIKISIGFRLPNKCDSTDELVLQTYSKTTDFPSYTNENDGRSTATFHFTDQLGSLLEQVLPNDYVVTNKLSGKVLQDIASSFGYMVDIPDYGNINISTTFTAGTTFEDIAHKLVELTGGQMYIKPNGDIIYLTYDYLVSQNPDPVLEINSCDFILEINGQTTGTIYNQIKVEQFSEAGGVECIASSANSIKKHGVQPYTLTNPLITDQTTACEIAYRILRQYEYGNYEREVTIVGIPYIESGDIITLVERVGSKPCAKCGCKTVKQKFNYRVCRVHQSFTDDGYRTKLTLNRVALPLIQAVICGDNMCDANYKICD